MQKKIEHSLEAIVKSYGKFICCPREYKIIELSNLDHLKGATSKKKMYALYVQGQLVMLMTMIDNKILPNPTK